MPTHATPVLLLTALLVLSAPGGVAAPQPGALVGSITVLKGRRAKINRANIVVYLQSGEPTAASAEVGSHEIVQTDKSFKPAVSVVQRGTTVSFPNDDRVFHNVFSLSKAARFDLGLYRSGTTKSVRFDKPGVIDVYCNIHPDMEAKILVVDTPYFAVTAKDGSFEIPGVPAGTYTAVAWHPRGTEFRGEVTIADGGSTRFDATVVTERGHPRHTQKDGTPYGRYR